MKIPNLALPDSPNFSCGPTRKPDIWEVKNLNQQSKILLKSGEENEM